MALNFTCMVIELDNNSKDTFTDILNKIGFEILDKYPSLYKFNEFETDDDLIIQKIDNKYLLFGDPLNQLVNLILKHEEIKYVSKNKITMHLIYQNTSYNSYFLAYYKDGRVGPANYVIGPKKKVWSKAFKVENLPIPHSDYVYKSFADMATLLDADIELIKRIYSGMHGKGNYGLGYHPSKQIWVACKKGIVDDDSELQEISQFNYSKKGKPFKKTTHLESKESFYNQTELMYEINKNTLINLIGITPIEFFNNSKITQYEKYKVKYNK